MARADRIFVNGNVWTGDERHGQVEAIAVEGERIVGVGSTADILTLAAPDTEIVELGGRRVIPGFNDAHWHFLSQMHDHLLGSDGLADVRARLRDLAARPHRDGAWLTTSGWGHADFPESTPHRRHIDDILPDRPAWILGRDGHMGLANSSALKLAGIDRDTPDPPQGRIERDHQGEPTGELKGFAMDLVANLVPTPSLEETVVLLDYVAAKAAAFGITSVQNMHGLNDVELGAIEQRHAAGTLGFRVYTLHSLDHVPDPELIERICALRDMQSDHWLKFGGVKIVLDGTIDAQTATMIEPLTSGNVGLCYWTAADLQEAVRRVDAAGLQIMIHACGDGAVEMAIDALAQARQGARHRIEHIDIPTDDQLRRMAAFGIIASSQPNFAYPDPTNLENYIPLLGPNRAALAQNYARIDAAGLIQCFGSDYPISSMDALRAMHTAVTRSNRDGSANWNCDQALSIDSCLRHFTQDGAFAAFDEEKKGRLIPGQLADFVVLSKDILIDDPESLLDAEVERTVVGGRTLYIRQDGARQAREPAILRPRGACQGCLRSRPARFPAFTERSPSLLDIPTDICIHAVDTPVGA